MPHVTFVSRNAGKVLSVQRGLSEFGIKVRHLQADLREIQSDLTSEVAQTKVQDAFVLATAPTLAMDAGFGINSLDGFPGPYTEYVLRRLGPDGIVRLLRGQRRRDCCFVESLAYWDGSGTPVVFEEVLPGRLAASPRGETKPHHWSSLALVFMPEGWDKTLAEMTDEEMRQWRCESQGHGAFYADFAKWYLPRKWKR